MATFVHLAPEARADKIRRNGIRRLRKALGAQPAGLFAVPVTPNFLVSHQWLRELRRRGQRNFVAVYFRIPDDEPVWLGHYGQAPRELTAAAAVGEFRSSADKQGWQVIVPRAVEPKEIHRIKAVPQVLGWRYFPGSNGKKPFCGCDFCVRGNYGARKLREQYRSFLRGG